MRKKTTEECIADFKKVWGNLYDYSEVVYKGDDIPVCIICGEHGEFWKTPSNHKHKTHPQGCPKCIHKYRRTNDEWIDDFKKVHGDKYDYSETNINEKDEKGRIKFICRLHGEFWQNPLDHLKGKNCKYCTHRNWKYTTEEWIDEARKIHGDRYIYNHTIYERNKKPVIITCKIHGDFQQIPSNHLKGNGCPYCYYSHIEEDMLLFLNKHKICFERQKKFSWLERQSLDFYLPQYNIAIECQGIQHFEPRELFGGIVTYDKQITLDNIKREKCLENGIKLLYYANFKYNFPYEVITDKNKLLKVIKEND